MTNVVTENSGGAPEPLTDGAPDHRADAVDAVRDLLDAVGINRVIVVDDEFKPDIADLLAAGAAAPKQKITLPRIGEVDFSSEPEKWRDELSASWHTLGLAEQDSALRELHRLSSSPPPILEELSVFHDLQPGVALKGMTPEEWDSERDSVIASAANSPTLVLFDLHLGSGRSEEGYQLAVDLYKADPGGHIWAGLLTNQANVTSEGSKWRQLTHNHMDDADRLLILSKEHFVDDARSFPEALRVGLISKPASTLNRKVESAITSCVNEAAQTIKRLSPPEFERIVFGLAKDEGIWETDMLLRLFDARLRSDVHDALHGDSEVQQATQLLRKLSEPIGETNPASVDAQRIYRDELYERPEHLNRFHLPVELGDIYKKIDGEKQFVLVGQPCDLMVRQNGKRSPTLPFVTLLPVRSNDPNAAEPDSKPRRAVFELPAFEDSNSAWVEMDRPCLVPVESVDYCALDDNGSGLAPTPGDAPDWIMPSWERRREMLVNEADELRETLSGLANNVERIAEVSARFGVRKECKAKPATEGNNFNLGLMRIGRIRSPYARALLTSYTAHLARDAYEPAIA